MPDEPYLTVAQVAELLKLNEQAVRNWIDQGTLPAVRAGSRRVRIRRRDVTRFVSAEYTGRESISEPAASAATAEWGVVGRALADATAAVRSADHVDAVQSLDDLADALRDLADTLRAKPGLADASEGASHDVAPE